MRACVYVWVWVHACMSVCVCTCACEINYPSMQSVCTVLYCHLSPLWLHLSIYIISQRERFSERRLFDIKFVFLVFSTILIWNISNSNKNSARYGHECGNVFMQNASCFSQILLRLEFSRQNFVISSNIRFNQNASCRRPSYFMRTDGRTDWLDEANSRYSQFCKRAQNSTAF